MLLMGGLTILDRMASAVERGRDRLLRATAALEDAEVPYAVVGSNAVFLWMTQHGEGGARFTSDPDRPDFLIDGPSGSSRTRLRLLFVGEKVCITDLLPNPDVSAFVPIEEVAVLDLLPLVQTKLTAFRRIDRVHLRDLLDVGLIDQTWTARYPPELAGRLQLLIDDPDG